MQTFSSFIKNVIFRNLVSTQAINMCLTPSSFSIRDIFLYRCFFSFLSTTTPLLVARLFLLFLSFFLSSNAIRYVIFYPKKLIPRYHVNEFLPDALAKIFYLLISMRLSLTVFIIPFKLQKCCFLYTNANPLLQFVLQFHSPTSHISITYLSVVE